MRLNWRCSERVRRTATRRSCRNSESTSSSVPGRFSRDHLEQAGEDDRGGLVRGLVGDELQVELGARARPGARRRRRPPRRRAGRSPRAAQLGRQHVEDALEVAVVATYGARGDTPASPGMSLDHHPDDGLPVAVEDGQRLPARAHAWPRGRARASRSPAASRARSASGRSASNQPWRGLRLGGGELVAGRAIEQREPAVGVAERHAVVVQAAVEGVVERRRCRRCAAGPHVEVLGEHARAASRSEPSGSRCSMRFARQLAGLGRLGDARRVLRAGPPDRPSTPADIAEAKGMRVPGERASSAPFPVPAGLGRVEPERRRRWRTPT